MKNEYQKAGKYVAICNKTNFDGHYVKVFDFPQKDDEEFIIGKDNQVYRKELKTEKIKELGIPIQFVSTETFVAGYTGMNITASWYFLNRIDFVACLEAVYPIETFLPIINLNTLADIQEQRKDLSW